VHTHAHGRQHHHWLRLVVPSRRLQAMVQVFGLCELLDGGGSESNEQLCQQGS